MDDRPLVLGLPGTGNNLIANLIGGAIHHYSSGLSRVDLDVPIILPIRDRELHWFRSTGKLEGAIDQRRKGKLPNPREFTTAAEFHYAHWWPTLNAIAGRRALIVRYEDVIADPEKWRHILCEHAGCGIREWPKPVTDENAKWRAQMQKALTPEQL